MGVGGLCVERLCVVGMCDRELCVYFINEMPYFGM